MTLYKLIEIIKNISLKHPNVGSVNEGDIYTINSSPSVKYANVTITQNSHSQDSTYDHYGLTLFYTDRLVDDMESNRLQIQSTGKQMLSNIINYICDEFDIECDNISFQPFTQRFTDECAGVYATITVDVIKETLCAEEYWDESWTAPIITIRNENKKVQFTENGVYTIEYDEENYTGLGKVEVEVNLDLDSVRNEGYQEGYQNGYDVGIESSYSVGYEDGYDKGNEDGYASGYDKGNEEGFANAETVIAEEAQELDITENGTYLTKYSDDIVIYPDQITGDFGDGNYFYNWGEIKDGCYNTEVSYEEGTVIELWWKYKDSKSNCYLFGNGYDATTDISLRCGSNSLYLRKGPNQFTIPIDAAIWQHIKIETNGYVYLNGNKVEGIDLSTISYTADVSPFLINNCSRYSDSFANGLFGMVKINEHIFIPKDGGFVNYRTEEQLGGYVKPTEGSYNYIESDQVTGYFDDGTPFYGYAVLNKVYFNTNIIPNNDTNLEIWWKDDGAYNIYATIIGTQQYGKGADGILKFCEYIANQNRWEFDTQNGTFPRDTNWHHLVLNKTAFYYDGEKYADVNGSLKETVVPIVINGLGLNPDITQAANGYFGMVKIDGKTFIPTENGYMDIDTQKLLSSNWISENVDAPFVGEYIFTENPIVIYEGEGNLIKAVNVNVKPKINVEKEGINFSASSFKEVPEWADWEGITNMYKMFYDCGALTELPLIDTSNVTIMERMLYYCGSLKTVPLLDTSKVTNMSYMFASCGSLTEIPLIDTSNVTIMDNMFSSCGRLITIPQLDTSKAKNMSRMLEGCGSLLSVPPLDARSLERQSYGLFGYGTLNNLTDFGGLIGLKASMDGSYCFDKTPNLTYQSCINILNGLYDFTSAGETPASNQGKLKVHQNFLTTVGDEISIGIDKGWTITA